MRERIQLGVTLIETALHGAELIAQTIPDPAVREDCMRALAKIHKTADEALAALRTHCPAQTEGVTLRSGGTGKNEPPPPPPGG